MLAPASTTGGKPMSETFSPLCDRLDFHCSPAVMAWLHVIRHLLLDLQSVGLIAVFAHGEAREQIFAPIIGCDEAEGLCPVDPLDRTRRLN
jgi:hypothetical protein